MGCQIEGPGSGADGAERPPAVSGEEVLLRDAELTVEDFTGLLRP